MRTRPIIPGAPKPDPKDTSPDGHIATPEVKTFAPQMISHDARPKESDERGGGDLDSRDWATWDAEHPWEKTGRKPKAGDIHKLSKTSKKAVESTFYAHYLTKQSLRLTGGKAPGEKAKLKEVGAIHDEAAKAHEKAAKATDDATLKKLHLKAAAGHKSAASYARNGYRKHPKNEYDVRKMISHTTTANEAVDDIRVAAGQLRPASGTGKGLAAPTSIHTPLALRTEPRSEEDDDMEIRSSNNPEVEGAGLLMLGDDGEPEAFIPRSEMDDSLRISLEELSERAGKPWKTADEVANKDSVQPKDNGGNTGQSDDSQEHKFQGSNFKSCKKCGSSINAKVHKPSWPKGKRSAELEDLRHLANVEDEMLELETRAAAVSMADPITAGTDTSQTDKHALDPNSMNHLFVGRDSAAECTKAGCGKYITDPIHKAPA